MSRAAFAMVEPASLRVAPTTASSEPAWDRFVTAHPESTFFHRFGWQRVLERVLEHETHYLVATRAGEIEGVLPLARVRSWLTGDALISTPFCVYGGPLAVNDEAYRALEDAACRLTRELGVDYLELRNRVRRRIEWPCKDLYVTFRKHLEPRVEDNLRAIPRKQRAMVRKGMEAGLSARLDTDVRDLYRAYSESLRNLGTPIFSRRYLEALRAEFGEDCEIQTITRAGQPVASVMSFYFRDEVLPYYGGGTREARDCNANDFMYWELMRRATERGLRVFDYGRSKRDTGAFRFKRHWGFEPEPLYYEYFLGRAQKVPNVSPANPKYRALIAIWQRLPLPLTHLIGPPLARFLG
jgi:FemAB-related protein (PEP-CTERM system-associated)